MTKPSDTRAARPILASLACWLALASQPISAQEAMPPDPVAADRYQVEIIVFRHLTGNVSAPPPIATDASTAPTSAAGQTWSPLAPAELRLGGAASRLRRPGVYELLYHGGWTQVAEDRNRAGAVPLPAEAAARGVLGTVTLSRERNLHVRLDLALTDGAGNTLARMQQGRRMKGQALQYFDDARFGVIVAARVADPSPPPAGPTVPPSPPAR